MNLTKISDSEISELKVSSLPTRPTAPTAFGGRGYTASEMKAAFDRLPLFIIERLNAIIDYVKSETLCDSIANDIRTEIADGHTLAEMLRDIPSGEFSDYLMVGTETLSEKISQTELSLSELDKKLKKIEDAQSFVSLDAGYPSDAKDVI